MHCTAVHADDHVDGDGTRLLARIVVAPLASSQLLRSSLVRTTSTPYALGDKRLTNGFLSRIYSSILETSEGNMQPNML